MYDLRDVRDWGVPPQPTPRAPPTPRLPPQPRHAIRRSASPQALSHPSPPPTNNTAEEVIAALRPVLTAGTTEIKTQLENMGTRLSLRMDHLEEEQVGQAHRIRATEDTLKTHAAVHEAHDQRLRQLEAKYDIINAKKLVSPQTLELGQAD